MSKKNFVKFRNKRMLLLSIILCISIMAFSACGGKENQVSEPNNGGANVESGIDNTVDQNVDNSGNQIADSGAASDQQTSEKQEDENQGSSGDLMNPDGEKDGANSGEADSSSKPSIQDALTQSKDKLNAETDDPFYLAMRDSYDNQNIPEEAEYICVPAVGGTYTPSAKYDSVTYKNMQGSWRNVYTEGGVEYVEILTVNGEYGKIESYADGVQSGVWNEEGFFSIEDRSADGKCPAIHIDGSDGTNYCTIYVRWVSEDAFYDGVFLNEWKRVEPEEYMEDNWLYDTVTLQNLQGVWFSNHQDAGGFYMDVLVIDGSTGTLLESVDGALSPYWNGRGPAEIIYMDYNSTHSWPELIIDMEEGAGGSAGIYITNVDVQNGRFYDSAFDRYWIRIENEPNDAYDFYDNCNSNLPYQDVWAHLNSYDYCLNGMGFNEENEIDRWKIDVYQEDTYLGTIYSEIEDGSNYYPDVNNVVSAEDDINGDGYVDVVVFAGSYGARGVEYGTCFLWTGEQFVELEGYDQIPDAWLDRDTMTIYGTLRDGAAAYEIYSYEIQGNKVVQTKTERYEYDEKLEDYILVMG